MRAWQTRPVMRFLCSHGPGIFPDQSQIERDAEIRLVHLEFSLLDKKS
jgi:hypothetical protein